MKQGRLLSPSSLIWTCILQTNLADSHRHLHSTTKGVYGIGHTCRRRDEPPEQDSREGYDIRKLHCKYNSVISQIRAGVTCNESPGAALSPMLAVPESDCSLLGSEQQQLCRFLNAYGIFIQGNDTYGIVHSSELENSS